MYSDFSTVVQIIFVLHNRSFDETKYVQNEHWIHKWKWGKEWRGTQLWFTTHRKITSLSMISHPLNHFSTYCTSLSFFDVYSYDSLHARKLTIGTGVSVVIKLLPEWLFLGFLISFGYFFLLSDTNVDLTTSAAYYICTSISCTGPYNVTTRSLSGYVQNKTRKQGWKNHLQVGRTFQKCLTWGEKQA